MKNSKIFVFGHKKPDTDAVTAAITASYLKNKLGLETEPRILGETNPETKFVLDYFKVKQPEFLNDVKVEVKDVEYNQKYFINSKKSIYNCYLKMCDLGITMLPVVDDKENLLGMIGMKNIAKEEIYSDDKKLRTSYENIIEALEAKEIKKYDEELSCNVLVASYDTDTFKTNVELDKNTALIVGNREDIIEYTLNKNIKLLIVTGGFQLKEEYIKIAEKNKTNIISTKFDTFKTANMISLCNYLENAMMTEEIITFNEHDELNECLNIANKVKYTNYPVINNKNKCLGLLRLSDIANHKKKQCILVDHNSYMQSATGIEEADIVEVIDHHNIGNVGTTMPINFRNMPLGSTNTVLYLMYKENNIEITKEIAGLMLSGILSDTLILTSPTTTEIDREIVPKLAKIAGVDYQKYGKEMIKAGSSLEGKTPEDVIYTDFKSFPCNNEKIGLSQFSTVNVDEIKEQEKDYINTLQELSKKEGYYVLAFFVTDVLENGSYMYYNEAAKDILKESFGLKEIKQGTYLPGVVSRKKQILPVILNTIEG